VRPSSYGVRVTEQALDALKGRRLAPFLVHGKPTPVCVDTAITPDVR
jgi:hypothetical protein